MVNLHKTTTDRVMKRNRTNIFCIIVIAFILLFSKSNFAQLAYNVNITNASYTSLTNAATVVQYKQDDQLTENIAIPFQFYFDAVEYSTLKISSNGWLSFGKNISSNANSNNLSNSSLAVSPPIIAPYWDDLFTDSIKVIVVGNSPNRKFIIEWKNVHCSNHEAADLSFQAILSETKNTIEFNYFKLSNLLNKQKGGASIGIKGAANQNDFLSISLNEENCVSNYGVENSHNYLLPSTNLSIAFVPTNSIAPGAVKAGLAAWWKADEKYLTFENGKFKSWKQVNNQAKFENDNQFINVNIDDAEYLGKQNNYNNAINISSGIHSLKMKASKKELDKMQLFFAVIDGNIITGNVFDDNKYFTIRNTIFSNPKKSTEFKIGEGLASRGSKISEILIYDHFLNFDETYKIESYLALKYGINLINGESIITQYFSSDGNKIWGNNNKENFIYAIAGIGRDDASDLIKTKSSSQFQHDVLSVELANSANQFTNDKSFLLWANNGESVKLNVSKNNLPKQFETKANCIYKLVAENFNQKVNLIFDKEIFSENENAADVRLIMSSNPDFKNAEMAVVLPKIFKHEIVFESIDLKGKENIYCSVGLINSSKKLAKAKPVFKENEQPKKRNLFDLMNSPTTSIQLDDYIALAQNNFVKVFAFSEPDSLDNAGRSAMERIVCSAVLNGGSNKRKKTMKTAK